MSYSDVIQRRLCQNGYRLTLAMILLLAVGCQRMEEESKAVGPVSSIEAEENSAVGMEPEAQHLYNLEGQAPFLLAHYLPWFENDSAGRIGNGHLKTQGMIRISCVVMVLEILLRLNIR